MMITKTYDLQNAMQTTFLDELLSRIAAKLQITKTQKEEAETRYLSIGEWLEKEDCLLAAAHPQIYSQGSFRIGTTVKPKRYDEYDIDLVCELQLDYKQCDPMKLLDVVYKRIKEHGTYGPMAERKNRCIRINYANEFHMDILPGLPDYEKGNASLKVPDRTQHSWKASNPKGYARWFDSKKEILPIKIYEEKIEPLPIERRKYPLQIIVQLLKRQRDIAFSDKSDDLRPISIVLTTLAAHNYYGQLSVANGLDLILTKVSDSIPDYGRLIVRNPTNAEEDLSEKWDDNPKAYLQFVDWIQELKKKWAQLINLTPPDVYIDLKKMFGENVTNDVIREFSDDTNKSRISETIGVAGPFATLKFGNSRSSKSIPKNTFFGAQF